MSADLARSISTVNVVYQFLGSWGRTQSRGRGRFAMIVHVCVYMPVGLVCYRSPIVFAHRLQLTCRKYTGDSMSGYALQCN